MLAAPPGHAHAMHAKRAKRPLQGASLFATAGDQPAGTEHAARPNREPDRPIQRAGCRGGGPLFCASSSFRARMLAALMLWVGLWTVQPPSANAQEKVVTGTEQNRYQSPRNFALEFRAGPYAPQVDNEFSGTESAPHEQFFGNSTRLMFQVELDYQFFQSFGSLAVSAAGGYFTEQARSFVAPQSPGDALEERSGDQTALTIFPLSVGLVYRFDVTARRWNLPIVPYGKLGLDYFIWSVTDGSDKISNPADGPRGTGATRGWYAAAGAAFLLDFLDPGSAQELDSEIGVNHTYAFVEIVRHDVSGLGQSRPLQLGDTTWQVGLMFEF